MPTKIGWTGETWNPTTGCDRISPGCDNCYALTLAKRLKRMGQAKYQNDGDPRTSGPGFALTIHPDTLTIPLGWTKPRFVFVNSMSDLFHTEVDYGFIAQVFGVMAAAPQHIFQVLTKRPQYMRSVVGDFRGQGTNFESRAHFEMDNLAISRSLDSITWPGWPLPNVWLGCSVENDRYTFRANHLRDTPAAVRWLSLEPLLGPLPSLDLTGIDWVVAGGESGPGHRPMRLSWLYDIAERCDDAGVPLFVKQDAHRHNEQQGRIPDQLWARKEFPTDKPRIDEPELFPEAIP